MSNSELGSPSFEVGEGRWINSKGLSIFFAETLLTFLFFYRIVEKTTPIYKLVSFKVSVFKSLAVAFK